ncbi:hypothetical protein ACN08Y_10455 [Rothia sp. P5764]|uniref:hypothetical protein n=1 Tax=Rothia sp. P5764 TaxID=3402654 RepID=UPI003AC9E5F1
MSKTDLPDAPKRALTSHVKFYLPGNTVSVKTSYLVAEAMTVILPNYATTNPGNFFRVSIGDKTRHVMPVNTAFSVSHDEVFEIDTAENRLVVEKLTNTLNDSLSLYFDEEGRLLSW